MFLISKNPATGSINKEIPEISKEEVMNKIEIAEHAFRSWRKSTLEQRNKLLLNLAEVLANRKEELAKLATIEVGQPVKAAISEIEKCLVSAQYFEGKIDEFLKPDIVKTDSTESYVSFEPMGVILGISPWNFPYWMAFRFIIPTISAGNVVLLKHSSNVPLCASAIEEVMLEAGFPEGVMQTLLIGSSKVEDIIKDPRVLGVSFAGGAKAGSIVASQSAANIKKSLLELGGSDPFIVLEDADLEVASKSLIEGRLRNAGQACNSPKRVFLPRSIHDDFVTLLQEKLATVKMGDPMDLSTDIGPIATESGLAEIESQVNKSIEKGAKLLAGGKRVDSNTLFFEPTILTEVKPGMPVFDQEVFGPVVAITLYESEQELLELANKSEYGLGASIWSRDMQRAKDLVPELEVANVFVNQLVRSDPRLPYGGFKRSGYGRELGSYGIKEFTNIKTIVIK